MFKRKKVFRAYREVFSDSPEVRTVFNDMCEAHNVFNGGFDPDPYEHARQAGERNVVLRILTILNMSPAEITALAEEGKEGG